MRRYLDIRFSLPPSLRVGTWNFVCVSFLLRAVDFDCLGSSWTWVEMLGFVVTRAWALFVVALVGVVAAIYPYLDPEKGPALWIPVILVP